MDSLQLHSSNDASSEDGELKLVDVVKCLPVIHSNDIIISLMQMY